MHGGTSDVNWRPPEGPNYVLPPTPEREDRPERVSSVVVAVLAVACTLLAVFDMFLLAFGL